MKVQLQEQTLRLRLDEAELAALQAGQAVGNRTRLLPDCVFSVRIHLTAVDESAMHALAGDIWVGLPRSLLAPYVARLPCREGLRIEFPLDGADRLTLDIEVDVRDSVRSRGPGRR